MSSSNEDTPGTEFLLNVTAPEIIQIIGEAVYQLSLNPKTDALAQKLNCVMSVVGTDYAYLLGAVHNGVFPPNIQIRPGLLVTVKEHKIRQALDEIEAQRQQEGRPGPTLRIVPDHPEQVN